VTPSATSSLSDPLLNARMESVAPPSPLLALTDGLARGDDAVWMQFHREYGPALFRQLLAATRGDHDLASEALQQTYLRIARHVRRCDNAAQFQSWMRVVARTALSDCRRRRTSFWRLLSRWHQDPTETGSSTRDEEEIEAVLAAELAALEPDNRALLEGKYFRGADVRTLADELGITPKAAESRLTRARAELRSRLIAVLNPHE
jgi:RNA polymerase sigma factor (sigma-70 family)